VKIRFAVSAGFNAPDPTEYGALVESVEAKGFDTLYLADLPSVPSLEPSFGLAFAAARTSRIKLGANFIPFGAAPFLVAHRLAQLDNLTGGRLLITFVPGLDLPSERAALGNAGRHRGKMMSAVIPQIREWWSGGGDPPLPVRPLQQPLEVWLGGSGPDAIVRAGQLSDGWLGSLTTPSRAGDIRRAIEKEAAAAGRTIDPEHFGLSIGYAHTEEDLAYPGRLRRIDPSLVPVGGPALRKLIGQLVDEGLSKFVVRPFAAVPAGGWDAELDWLADTILDLQT
jgi:alkanesulfonate monooxygenase SsuD/methylene tetrahydromethanopterin reductase-like flavin-dependent oxidoreductase (luciferase family)